MTLIQTSNPIFLKSKDEIILKTTIGYIMDLSGKLEAIIMKMKKNSFDQKYLFKLLDIDRVKDKVN